MILQKTYWQSGVLLHRSENKAIVKADLEDKKIFIWINGKKESRRKLLSIIRSNFEHIHSTISKLEINEVIPIPNHKNISIDYKDLVKLEEKEIKKHYYPKIDEEINVSELLNGLETKEERKAKQKQDKDDNFLKDIEEKSEVKKEKKFNKIIGIFTIIGVIASVIGLIYTIYISK